MRPTGYNLHQFAIVNQSQSWLLNHMNELGITGVFSCLLLLTQMALSWSPGRYPGDHASEQPGGQGQCVEVDLASPVSRGWKSSMGLSEKLGKYRDTSKFSECLPWFASYSRQKWWLRCCFGGVASIFRHTSHRSFLFHAHQAYASECSATSDELILLGYETETRSICWDHTLPTIAEVDSVVHVCKGT